MKPEELEQLKIPIYDRVKDAIEKGDKNQAFKLLDELKEHKEEFKQGLLLWISDLLKFVGDKLGDEGVYEHYKKHAETLNAQYVRFFGDSSKMSIEDKMRRRSREVVGWHLMKVVDIKEDEEKYIWTLQCDSGGWLLGQGVGKTKKAYPWTYGRKNFSYYCAHCSMGHEIEHIESLGYPDWVVFPPEKAGDPCIQYFYKDPKSVPEKYYARVGKKKVLKP
jgi:hypothetical protein